jgi:hypothetical protein
MSRRKGELTKSRMDRDYPHQVALPADQCTGENGRIIEAFCADLSVAPRKHSFRRDDRWHVVCCFADPAHAERFRERFGGEAFDPKLRGRGRQWHKLRDVPRSPR